MGSGGAMASAVGGGHGEGGGHVKRELSAPLLDPNAKRGRRITKESKRKEGSVWIQTGMQKEKGTALK
eukprot:scaffold10972_cov22-Tisochrysis_lutea.AAC.1